MFENNPEIFYEPEEPNLHDMLEIVQAQTTQFENSATYFINKGTAKSMESVDDQIGALSESIRNALIFVSESEEYPVEEKAGLMASILVDDDKRRVEFLNKLCEPPEERLFRVGYPDETLIATQISQMMDFYDSPEDAVQKIFEYHMVNMEKDMDYFSRTPIAIEKMATREQIEKIQSSLIRIGETVIGTALGIYLAINLSNKRHKK